MLRENQLLLLLVVVVGLSIWEGLSWVHKQKA